ncbi:unnamed protein product, partial [marine sediment metagenome]
TFLIASVFTINGYTKKKELFKREFEQKSLRIARVLELCHDILKRHPDLDLTEQGDYLSDFQTETAKKQVARLYELEAAYEELELEAMREVIGNVNENPDRSEIMSYKTNGSTKKELPMSEMVLLGDEALAMGAIHAGLSVAYGYPGTPSSEIMEFLQNYSKKNGGFLASWCSNEKTAYEEAVGVSMVGKRALVTMKHVGLNVAADAFINSALLNIHGGLVLAVADDPGMHSSQNEQDSRFYADFARIVCLEPRNQQEAYKMIKEAFDLSERFHIPIMVRLVTR